MARVEWHEDEAERILTSPGMRQRLDAVAFTITAHAVPHSGRDTGRLAASMSHRVEVRDGRLVAILGSNAETNAAPVEYAEANWEEGANGKPTRGGRVRKKDGHISKSTPRKPYQKALNELNIEYREGIL